jgi:glycosyltransferase involved in cell wall biosynthesis
LKNLSNKKIIIIDNSDLSYSGEDIDGTVVRGTEASLILLSEQFVKMGINVDYCNSLEYIKKINGVNYFNKNNIDKNLIYDLAIAISDANEFRRVSSVKKAVFSNSNQPIEKFIRKKQLIPFLKFKPTLITLCDYQFERRSFFTSFYGKKTIPITVDPKFLDIEIDNNFIPEKKVVYNIRSNRNLDHLIKIWCEKIYPINSDFKLYITPDLIDYKNHHKENNIFLRTIGSRSEMIDELKSYRALTYLGHKSDIFTLTAEEAIKICLPVVTFGIGSLKERVTHNETGFIAKNDQEFADYTIKLLDDDDFYLNLKRKMSKNRKENNWDYIANEWVKYFLNE